MRHSTRFNLPPFQHVPNTILLRSKSRQLQATRPTADGPGTISNKFMAGHLSATGDRITQNRKDMTVLVPSTLREGLDPVTISSRFGGRGPGGVASG